MLKVLGVVLLLAGFCGLSFEKVREEKLTIIRVNELKKFTTYLLKEIEYSNIPIPDICEEYVERSEGELKDFLGRVCEQFRINTGKSFLIIWQEEIGNDAANCVYRKEEKQLLEDLSKSFGFCNTKMQLIIGEYKCYMGFSSYYRVWNV